MCIFQCFRGSGDQPSTVCTRWLRRSYLPEVSGSLWSRDECVSTVLLFNYHVFIKTEVELFALNKNWTLSIVDDFIKQAVNWQSLGWGQKRNDSELLFLTNVNMSSLCIHDCCLCPPNVCPSTFKLLFHLYMLIFTYSVAHQFDVISITIAKKSDISVQPWSVIELTFFLLCV